MTDEAIAKRDERIARLEQAIAVRDERIARLERVVRDLSYLVGEEELR